MIAAHHDLLVRLEGELTRHAEAIADTGPLATILQALTMREQRATGGKRGQYVLALRFIAFAAGGCVVAAEPPAVAVAAPAPFVWIGPGYYGGAGAYYHAYPGPGYYGPYRHHWR